VSMRVARRLLCLAPAIVGAATRSPLSPLTKCAAPDPRRRRRQQMRRQASVRLRGQTASRAGARRTCRQDSAPTRLALTGIGACRHRFPAGRPRHPELALRRRRSFNVCDLLTNPGRIVCDLPVELHVVLTTKDFNERYIQASAPGRVATRSDDPKIALVAHNKFAAVGRQCAPFDARVPPIQHAID
jgi:hypothetical protein